ncbi:MULTISPECIES: amidase [unclassified Sinorhizobium]|uniref:amidase n=1 Tax=unclassified Sinorhizobium TaxID=2613772 RepID=UPI0024C37C44|nr:MULTISPECIES: amidase [unclassified Sinorhizobium]MDK1378243.1 amidase [Sinorhizobium sp. 6-70]MDK1480374.1 amidase [Sinorhizobium sp. 6-117]
MKLTEYVGYDATGLASLVTSKEVTPAELTRLAREACNEVNPRINAVIEFYDDAENVAGLDTGVLNGVPFLRKDLGAAEAGRLQERGSRLFQGCRTHFDSNFIRRARAGGLRCVGRTTTTELGTSGLSESILNGITGNPWDPERSAGGSSCGAAAAVAAGITPIASAGDGGGSIRTPAAWCGLVGLNPSRGRISGGPNNQDAAFGLARHFVVCRSVRDMAAALDIFAGPQPGDPFIIVQPDRPYREELLQATGVLRVGVAISRWGELDVAADVREAVQAIAALFEDMGHEVEEIAPPYQSHDYSKILLGMSDLNATSLAAAAHAIGRSISPATLEPMNLRLYERGRDLPLSNAADLHEAIRRMRLEVGEAIAGYDLLLTPTMPTVAVPHGGKYSTVTSELTPEEFMEADAAFYQHLGVFNVTGNPSVSLPLAMSADGLPIGLQLVGRMGDEATLVRVARDLEVARPWSQLRPKVRAGANCRSAQLA